LFSQQSLLKVDKQLPLKYIANIIYFVGQVCQGVSYGKFKGKGLDIGAGPWPQFAGMVGASGQSGGK
jgi:hypothetical protein